MGKSPPPLILALDMGTSSARTALFDARGGELPGTRFQRKYRLHTSEEGAAELDPRTFLRRVAECIDQTLGQLPGKTKIVAVGACSLWHSLIGVDVEFRPLTGIVTWADTRGKESLAAIGRAFDPKELWRRTGCPLHASYWPAKLSFLRKQRPGLFRKSGREHVHAWLSPADFVYAQFLGRWSVSHSMASATGLYSQRRNDWDEQLLEYFGLAREQVGQLRRLDETATGLQGKWRRRWPALAEAAWVPPVGDGAASNVGCGCVRPGVAALMVGTSAAVRVAEQGRGGRAIPWGLWRYRIERDEPLVGGAISNGGAIFAWLRDTLRLPRDFERRIAKMPPFAHGLTVLPLLMGERTPNWRSDVSGAITGLRGSTGPLEIARAFMEAVALRCATMVQLVDRAEKKPVRLVGTGEALRDSEVWPQMLADAMGRPIEISAVEEGSLRGAAILAAGAMGLSDESPAMMEPPVSQIVEPVKENVGKYREAMRRMQRLYDAQFPL